VLPVSERQPCGEAEIDVVLNHLATVAVDGAGPDMADTMAADFSLHIDGYTTDRNGYLALVAARWAVEGDRPPLDVLTNQATGAVVTAALVPRSVAHFRVDRGVVCEAWLTTDWSQWLSPLDGTA